MSRRASLLGALCLFLASGAGGAPEQGGQGKLYPRGEQQVECFKTRSNVVPEICGPIEVRWKMTSLMGEPVVNFGLVWSIASVQIQGARGLETFRLNSLPAPLAQAAQRSELMITGMSHLMSGDGSFHGIDVDTGAPVRADGSVSFNVAGSPDWDRFIVLNVLQLGSGFNVRACQREGRSHLSAARAKDAFRKGIQLQGLYFCPATSANADALERAIDRQCKAAPGGAWCSPRNAVDKDKKDAEAPALAYGDALDKAADRPGVQRQHAQMLDAYRREAQAACTQELAPVQACRRQQCAAPAGPDEARCQAVPAKPWRNTGLSLTRTDNGPCDAACQRGRAEAREAARQERERQDRAFEARVAAWESQWGALAAQCVATRDARAAQAQCVAAAEPRCNPAGLTPQSCLQRRMADAPTTAEAQDVFDKNTSSRLRSGQSPRFLD